MSEQPDVPVGLGGADPGHQVRPGQHHDESHGQADDSGLQQEYQS